MPVLQSSNDVILRVKACGVCRSDWHGWKGHDGDIATHGLPFVPGHELAGEVVDVGGEVTRLKPGDAVVVPFILSCGECRECARGRRTVCRDQEQPGFTGWGGLAEYVRIPRADRNLSVIPDGVSFKAAAALGCRLTTAFRAVVQRGGLGEGDTLAVFGTGGLGLSCVMIGAAVGAKIIIAVDVSRSALAKARSLGATHSVLLTQGTHGAAQEAANALLEMTAGIGVDITVDAGGFADTCQGAVLAASRAGRVVQAGLPLGEHESPAVAMARVVGFELDVVGSHGFDAQDMPALLHQVKSGVLDPEALIDKEVSLEEAAMTLMSMDEASPVGITVVTNFYTPTLPSCRL